MNLFDCEIVSLAGRPAVRLAGKVLAVDGPTAQALSGVANGRVRLGVRPPDIDIVGSAEDVDSPILASEVVVVEPSAALGVAAVLENRERFAGRRVATILCGSNVTTDDFSRWALGKG